MCDAFLVQHRFDPRSDLQALERLRQAAENVKIALTSQEQTQAHLREIAFGVGGAHLDLVFGLSRPELEKMTEPLLERTFKVTQDALALARLAPSEFDRTILVGGTSRMPLVRRRVEAFFGAAPLDRMNPDEVVAIGAAIQAAALTDASRRRSIPPPPTGFAVPRKSAPSFDDLSPQLPPARGQTQSQMPTLDEEDVATQAMRRESAPPSSKRVPPSSAPSTARGLAAPAEPPQTARTGPPQTARGTAPPLPTTTARLTPGPPPAFPRPPTPPPMAVPLAQPLPPAPAPAPPSSRMPRPPTPASPFASTIASSTGHERPGSIPDDPRSMSQPFGTIEEPHSFIESRPITQIPQTPHMIPATPPPPPGGPQYMSQPPRAPVFTASMPPPVLIDVTPRALVVETAGGFCDTVIPRNAQIPCERTRVFATAHDGQQIVRVRVAQGEDPAFHTNTFLGEVELGGIRAASRGEVSVSVTFELDADGTLRVRASDTATGRQATAQLHLQGIAGESEITSMRRRMEQSGSITAG